MSEPELREMVKRDISLALTRQPALRPTLAATYDSASADGKIFAQRRIPRSIRAILNRYARNTISMADIRSNAPAAPDTELPAKPQT